MLSRGGEAPPRPLPAAPPEACGRACGRGARAGRRVPCARDLCSAGRLLVGREVDLRVTESKLEVFLGGEHVATHPLFPSHARNRYSTNAGDMPEGRSYSDWDAPRIRRWADRVGPSCREIVDRLFAPYGHAGQALDGCLAVLRLSNRYSAPRLERACAMALAAGKRSPRRRGSGPIPKADRDRLAEAGDGGAGPDGAGYVRGASFYGRE